MPLLARESTASQVVFYYVVITVHTLKRMREALRTPLSPPSLATPREARVHACAHASALLWASTRRARAPPAAPRARRGCSWPPSCPRNSGREREEPAQTARVEGGGQSVPTVQTGHAVGRVRRQQRFGAHGTCCCLPLAATLPYGVDKVARSSHEGGAIVEVLRVRIFHRVEDRYFRERTASNHGLVAARGPALRGTTSSRAGPRGQGTG